MSIPSSAFIDTIGTSPESNLISRQDQAESVRQQNERWKNPIGARARLNARTRGTRDNRIGGVSRF